MPLNNNAARMTSSPDTAPQFIVEEWVDMPEDVMRKLPSLREWNAIMSDRWRANQLNMAEFIRSVQEN